MNNSIKKFEMGPKELEIPANWDPVYFDDVIELNPSYEIPDEESFPFLPMDAIDEDTQTIDYWDERDKDDCTRIRFKDGDTVYAKITPCTENGKIAFIEGIDGLAFGSTEFLVFHPKDGVTDPKFVYYLANMPRFRAVTISLMEGSTGRQRVPRDIFKQNLKIPLPPLPEQRKIASILSTVDDAIRGTNEVIERTRELKRGLMQDLLTKGIGHDEFKEVQLGPKSVEVPVEWDTQSLSEMADVNMGSSPSSKYYNEKGEGLPFFQGNAEFGVRHPSPEVWCTNPNKIAENGDVLVSVRAPVGDLNIAKDRCCIGRGLAAIRGTTVRNEYLYYLLKIENQRLASYAQGSTFDAINKNVLESFPLAVPKLEEQKEIIAILSTVDEKIREEQEHRERLQELKNGLMQDLLTGKVRVPVDSR